MKIDMYMSFSFSFHMRKHSSKKGEMADTARKIASVEQHSNAAAREKLYTVLSVCSFRV